MSFATPYRKAPIVSDQAAEIHINGHRVWAFLPIVKVDPFTTVRAFIAGYLIVAERETISGSYITGQINSLADDEWFGECPHATLDHALASLYRRAGVIGQWTENRISS